MKVAERAMMWRYRLLGEEFGPVPAEGLRELIASGVLSLADDVSPSDGSWGPVSDFPELLAPPGSDDSEIVLDDDLSSLLEQAGAAADIAETARETRAARDEWFVQVLGQVLGPLGWDELTEMAARGELAASDPIRRGQQPWQPAGEIVGLIPSAAGQAPAVDPTPAEDEAAEWYQEVGSLIRGPLSFSELRQLAADGQLGPRDRVREGRQGAWLRAAALPGLFLELEESRSISGLAGRSTRDTEADAAADAEADQHAAEVEAVTESTTAPEAAASQDQPPDQWSDFFSSVEARERKKWKRESLPSVPKSPAPPVAAVSLAAPAAPEPAPTSPAFSAPSIAASAAPQFTPPPRPKRSASLPRISLPSINLSGLLGGLKCSGSGLSTRLLVPLALAVIVAAGVFVPNLLGGVQGVKYYDPLEQLWQEVVRKHEAKASAAEWQALAAASLPLLDEAQQTLAPVVKNKGSKSPLAQRLLWMVDTESGPTKAKGYLRRVLESGGNIKPSDIEMGTSLMSEAATLLPPR